MAKLKKNSTKKVHVRHGQRNILYTGVGDKGTTTLYHCNQQRISKSANIIEALGALDELNAYLGIVKVFVTKDKAQLLINKKNIPFYKIIDDIQQTLFIIQAEVAGGEMIVSKSHVSNLEEIILIIGDIIPPITSFTISGGSLLSAELDFSRTLARRAERRMVTVMEEGVRKFGPNTIAYMNRLSSVLFAMSRYINHILSIKEEHPKYKNM